MLIFTNRELEDRADESALQRSFASGSPRLALATVERAPQGRAEHWNLTQPDDDVDDADSLRALLPLFQGSLRLLVYLHGYNNTPAACFERCALLQSLYDGTTWSLSASPGPPKAVCLTVATCPVWSPGLMTTRRISSASPPGTAPSQAPDGTDR